MPKDLQYDDEELDIADSNNEVDVDDNFFSGENDSDQENLNRLKIEKRHSPTKNETGSNRTDTKLSRKDKTSRVDGNSDHKGNSQEAIKLENDSEDLLSDNDDDSKFFVVRVAGGQESMIASMLQTRLNTKKIDGIYSVLFLENFKGYVIVEAVDSNIAYEALHGIRHIRGQIRGELPFKDLEGYLIKKPVVTELTIDDTVEIIAGPFKSMKAKITRVDYEKQEATVVLLDSPYQIPVTVDANYLKKSL
jgi:transcriptional antiterminator NusG